MSSAPSLHVTVIAKNAATVDGLDGYLKGTGVAAHTCRALTDVATVLPATTALVIFPDEFSVEEVVASITTVRATRPRLLVILVTAAPQRFHAALVPDGRSLPPVVLPKPAFGWTILDAVRAHASSEEN